MRCKETSGILFNHPCDQDATLSCNLCNKPLCERHMRYQADKPTCISCVRGHLQEQRKQGLTVAGAYERDPYFFYYYGSRSGGHGESFDDSDFELFDGGGDAGAAYAMDDEGAWAGS